MTLRKINYCCKECGSDDIVFDSSSDWDVETQAYQHRDCYDHPPCCNSDECEGAEVEVQVVDVDTGEKLGVIFNYEGVFRQHLPIAEVDEINRQRSEQWAAQRAREVSDKNAEITAVENAKILALAYEGLA